MATAAAVPAPIKPGVFTSEFWLHIIAIITATATFWPLAQHYLQIAGASGMVPAQLAGLIPIALAFCGFMAMLVKALQSYTGSRTDVKTAAAQAGDAAASTITTPDQAAAALAAAGKALIFALVFGLALGPSIARADEVAATSAQSSVATVKSCTVDPDGSLVPHGVWLSDAQAIIEAQSLERLKAENAQLHQEPKTGATMFVIVAVVALAGGFAAGWVLHK